jgi:hypothetical protein
VYVCFKRRDSECVYGERMWVISKKMKYKCVNYFIYIYCIKSYFNYKVLIHYPNTLS